MSPAATLLLLQIKNKAYVTPCSLSSSQHCRVAKEQTQPQADEAETARAEAERRTKLQQHLSAALSTAILPCPPMVLRSAASLAAHPVCDPAEDAPEDAAYWDLVSATLPKALHYLEVDQFYPGTTDARQPAMRGCA